MLLLSSVKVPRFRAYRIDGFVQQVPLAGGNFTDAVIRAAGVFLGGEFSPVRCGVGIQQGFALEHTIYGAVQGGVAPRFVFGTSRLSITGVLFL